MKATRTFFSAASVATAIFLLGVSAARPHAAQDTSQKPAEKTPEKSQEKPEIKPASKLPAEIELLETRVRFEANGDSRKEVHAFVKINDELGVRQFARLIFDFNRGFEQIEIPLVRITHPSGGTADVLPSAITDTPNPAVVNAPAYQDVRVKSVRILGLEPGDSLEYRVITTVSHHPLAPDFWLEHTFDRTGVVSHEIFELEVPVSRTISPEYSEKLPTPHINPTMAATSIQTVGQGSSERTTYRWDRKASPHACRSTRPPTADMCTVAIGCTGGQHRSVYIAERLAERISAPMTQVAVRHSALPELSKSTLTRARRDLAGQPPHVLQQSRGDSVRRPRYRDARPVFQ